MGQKKRKIRKKKKKKTKKRGHWNYYGGGLSPSMGLVRPWEEKGRMVVLLWKGRRKSSMMLGLGLSCRFETINIICILKENNKGGHHKDRGDTKLWSHPLLPNVLCLPIRIVLNLH